MPRFKCLECNTRLHSAESEADPIGDLCTVRGSLLEPVADLGEIVGYRVAGSPGSASHSGAEGAGQLIAGRVGEIIARRELKYARVRLEIGSCDAHSPNPQAKAARFRAPGRGEEAVRRRGGARTTAAPPRLPRVLGAFDAGCRRRERRRQAKFAFRPRPRFEWRAMKWDRARVTKTTTPPRVAPTRRSPLMCSWSAGHGPTWAR
jgi:hypothetical protein